MASLLTPPLSQLSSRPRLGPDVVEPQPGVTTGTRRTFQALGVHDWTSAGHFHAHHPLGQGARAPPMEQSGSATAPQPQAAPGAAPPPSAPPPHLLFRLNLLRIMGIRLPNRRPLVGFLQALLPLAQLMTPARRRRPVMRRAMSPLETPPCLVWLNSYVRSARTHVHCRTLRVHRAAGLRLGSASQCLHPPGSASGFIPESRR